MSLSFMRIPLIFILSPLLNAERSELSIGLLRREWAPDPKFVRAEADTVEKENSMHSRAIPPAVNQFGLPLNVEKSTA